MASKSLITTFAVLFIASPSLAGVDLSKLANFNGLTGTGLNAYEQGAMPCTIEINQEQNLLTIKHEGAYFPRMWISGDDVVNSKESADGLTLDTKGANPSMSGLCGDYLKASNVKRTAVITDVSVEITLSYRCSLFGIGETRVDKASCDLD